MTEEKKVQTKGSQKSLQAARNTYKFIKEDYAAGRAHQEAGKPVVWSCAMVEKELYYSMGLHPYYPENYAAICATQRKDKDNPEGEKEAVRFARIAEQSGYSGDLCGYQRVATGYVMNKNLADGPLGGMPKPDMMVTTSYACDCRLKWFEDMAQRLNVPLFTLDRPERVIEASRQHPLPHEVKYYKSVLEDYMSFVTDITGIKYDEYRLKECMDWSYKTNEVRLEITNLRKATPSPMSSADGFATMYPGMYCSGTEKAFNFYKELRDEVKARVVAGQGVIDNEKFRLMWMGIPLWFNMGIFNYFEDIGGVFAYEPAYNPTPWPVPSDDDPLTELAVRTLYTGSSMNSSNKSLTEQCAEFNLQGAVLASLLTCRPVYLPILEFKRILQKKADVPSVMIECDLVDERSYSEAQVKTRMDAFGEQILAKMAAKMELA